MFVSGSLVWPCQPRSIASAAGSSDLSNPVVATNLDGSVTGQVNVRPRVPTSVHPAEGPKRSLTPGAIYKDGREEAARSSLWRLDVTVSRAVDDRPSQVVGSCWFVLARLQRLIAVHHHVPRNCSSTHVVDLVYPSSRL